MPQKRSLESIVSLVEESRDRERGLHPVVLAALRELFENSKECRVCATLALKLGSTERTLRRWFSAQLGCTVAEMIGYVALYESLRLLVEDPYRTLEELAARTGYAHARTLACAWQRRTGISPAHAVRAVRELQLASGDESAWDDLQRVAAEIDRRRPPPPGDPGSQTSERPTIDRSPDATDSSTY